MQKFLFCSARRRTAVAFVRDNLEAVLGEIERAAVYSK
jgi:hypothetical protein